jgi:hypothetical protein
MKTADCYYNTSCKQVILSGGYDGGTWRIELGAEGKWSLHTQPKHCRGFLFASDSDNLLDVLELTEKL